MLWERKLKLTRSHSTSYCLMEVVTKAGLTVLIMVTILALYYWTTFSFPERHIINGYNRWLQIINISICLEYNCKYSTIWYRKETFNPFICLYMRSTSVKCHQFGCVVCYVSFKFSRCSSFHIKKEMNTATNRSVYIWRRKNSCISWLGCKRHIMTYEKQQTLKSFILISEGIAINIQC